MAFYTGQKVVCVDIGATTGYEQCCPIDGLELGAVYTVLRVYTWTYQDCPPFQVCSLAEISRTPEAVATWGPNAGFAVHRFRPAVQSKTDISVFTSLLTPKPVPERV